jgi:hypothetical protein
MKDTFLSLSEDLKDKVFQHIQDGLGKKPTKDDISKVGTIITTHIVGGDSHPGDKLLIDYDNEVKAEFEYTLAENLLSELHEELGREPTEDEFCSFVWILESVVRNEATEGR